MTSPGPVRCLCNATLPDRKEAARHMQEQHKLPMVRALIVAYRIQAGEAQDPSDLVYFGQVLGGKVYRESMHADRRTAERALPPPVKDDIAEAIGHGNGHVAQVTPPAPGQGVVVPQPAAPPAPAPQPAAPAPPPARRGRPPKPAAAAPPPAPAPSGPPARRHDGEEPPTSPPVEALLQAAAVAAGVPDDKAAAVAAAVEALLAMDTTGAQRAAQALLRQLLAVRARLDQRIKVVQQLADLL